MTKIKKLTSAFLAVIMALGVLTVAPFTVGAASNSDNKKFADLLRDIYYNPGKYYYYLNNSYSDVTDNQFALADIDSDGKNELIVTFIDTITASMHSRIWKINNSNNNVYEYAHLGIYPEFYSNGIAKVKALHNQGPSRTFWPYSLYKYDNTKREYVIFASAYCVDKEVDIFGEYSPAKDIDNDGTIYYFNFSSSEYKKPLTKVEYDTYVNTYTPSSKKIAMSWKNLTLSNINSVENTPSPTSVKLNRSSLTLGVGEKYGLIKTVSPSSANQSCTWSSSNSSIASVDSSGKVTAKKTGTANITVKTSNGKTASCKVTVKPAPASVKTNPTSVTLGIGETYTISESTNSGTYANATNLKWSTSNSGVATVAKGSANKATITAKGVGTTYIKITLYNGKTATCKVTVKNAPSSVKTSPASVTLGKGETLTICENTNSGSYANAANLKWSTSNSSVATVTKGSGNKAKITAKGVGTAYIKITLYNGKTAQCKVTVKNAPSSVKVNPTRLTLRRGDTYTISETTNSGAYANAANLKWSTSNSSVATVTKGSGNKATITAKSVGTAYIKITLYNGKTATCKVNIK